MKNQQEFHQFPKGFFPPEIEAYIDFEVEKGDHDRSAICQGILTVISAAMGKSNFLNKPYRITPPIWAAFIAPTGAGKTPVFQIAIKPLQEIDSELNRKFDAEFSSYQDALKRKDKTAKEPVLSQILVIDSTKEALISLHKGNPNGILFFNDELKGLLQQFGQYKGGKGNDHQIFLQLFDGTSIKVNRKHSPTIHLDNTHVCILGGFQPFHIQDFMSDGRLEDGFFFRFLFILLSEPKKKYYNMNVSQEENKYYDDYLKLVKSLYYDSVEHEYTLSVETEILYKGWYDSWVDRAYEDPIETGLQSKFNTYVLRIALIHHVLHRPECPEIQEDSIEQAIKAIEFFRSNSYEILEYVYKSNIDKMSDMKKEFFKSLEPNQSYPLKELQSRAEMFGINKRTLQRTLKESSLVIKTKHGVYKLKDEQ